MSEKSTKKIKNYVFSKIIYYLLYKAKSNRSPLVFVYTYFDIFDAATLGKKLIYRLFLCVNRKVPLKKEKIGFKRLTLMYLLPT